MPDARFGRRAAFARAFDGEVSAGEGDTAPPCRLSLMTGVRAFRAGLPTRWRDTETVDPMEVMPGTSRTPVGAAVGHQRYPA